MIKAVLLDSDDTLLDFTLAEHIALKKTLNSVGIDPKDETISLYSEINKRHWEMLERGELTRAQVLTQRFDRLFEALGIKADSTQTQAIYERNLSIGHYFIPGAVELLEALNGKYKLYITSNGTAFVQDRRIAGTGIARYFDAIFISERIGANKPDTAFFDGCFAAMENKNREETIIIGDSLTSDIKGGIAAGIHTCHFDRRGNTEYGEVIPEFRITKLSEIKEILGKI